MHLPKPSVAVVLYPRSEDFTGAAGKLCPHGHSASQQGVTVQPPIAAGEGRAQVSAMGFRVQELAT